MIEHYRLAVLDVRGDGPIGNRQLVEVAHGAHVEREAAQGLSELLTLDESLGQDELAVLEPERKAHEERLIVLLAPEGHFLPGGAIGERVLPVDRAERLFDLARGQARGVQAADNGAHAGAGDGVDRHAQLLEHLQHADVSSATRAAAAQHQADARPTERLEARGRGNRGVGGSQNRLCRWRGRICRIACLRRCASRHEPQQHRPPLERAKECGVELGHRGADVLFLREWYHA